MSIETAGNSSKEAAEGINHALLKFDGNGRVKFVAQGSDAGGGGLAHLYSTACLLWIGYAMC